MPSADPTPARVQEEALESLRNTVAFLESQLAQVKADFEKVSKELVGETAAKVDAQIARDLAELRVRRLEEKITEAAVPGESVVMKTSLSRLEAQLEHNRQELERLAKDLEAERTARVKAETNVKALEDRLRRLRAEVLDRLTVDEAGPELDLEDSDAMLELMIQVGEEVPGLDEDEEDELALKQIEDKLAQESEVQPPQRRRKAPLLGGIAAMLVGAALTGFGIYSAYHWGDWVEAAPQAKVARQEVSSAPPPEQQASVEAPVAPAPIPAPVKPPELEPTGPGKLLVSGNYAFKVAGEEKKIPAAGAPIVLAAIKMDEEACAGFLNAAGVDKSMHEALAQWLYIGRPEQAKVEQFAESCRLLGVYANQVGREAFSATLAGLMQIEPAEKWIESELSDEGVAAIESIESGRYLLLRRPDGDKQDWAAPGPVSLEDERVAVIRKDETTELSLTLTDDKSAITGTAADAESGASIAAVRLVMKGDAVGAEDGITVVTGDDGRFTVDPAAMGYGEFTIQCPELPVGYRAATLYRGSREAGEQTSAVPIQFSKRAAKTVTISGRVLTADRQPVKDFNVFRISRDGNEQKLATTDEAGEFRVELPSWSMRLFAAGPGDVRSEVVEFNPEPGEHVRKDIVMPPLGRVVLNIWKPDDSVPETLENVSVKSGGKEIQAGKLIIRDGDNFVLPRLAPGEYELAVKIDGFKDVLLTGLVIDEANPEANVDVRLEPLG